MKFNLGCKLNYNVAQSSTMVFNISAIGNDYQKVSGENLKINPQIDFDDYIYPLTENRYIRLNAPAGSLQISYQATVELSHFYAEPDRIPEVPVANLPLDTLCYLYPSRYCQSDKLMRLAQSEFGGVKPGYSRVIAICDWIYDKVIYKSGSTDSQTSAYDTATERAGVCRDFAHLGIAFCRALNIPARFVGGYAYQLKPPDFHAYFEAYLGGHWYIFDATRLAPRNGFIRIGTGRDAADVSFGTLFGPVKMEEMHVFVECVDDSQEIPSRSGEAIATT